MKSDQEKLMDVLEGYKDRRAMIGKAALENCTLEQAAVNDCYKKGTWGDTMTMCRPENQAFTRCYVMQAIEEGITRLIWDDLQRFLKALGYLSAYDRPAEIDEEIQMHADKLYHTMLSREAAIASAKASNSSIPDFPPLIPPSMPSTNIPSKATSTSSQNPSPLHQTTTTTTTSTISTSAPLSPSAQKSLTHVEQKNQFLESLRPQLRPSLEKEWDKKGLNEEERMLEARALAMEAEAGIETADEVGRMIKEERAKRKERREKGEAGWGDTVSGWFGW
ncbi:MAG: hypothetical protein Q9181_006310 [Wetmoreana brouardii]